MDPGRAVPRRRPRHHRHRRALRGHGYFKRLGPGFITGAADDDPGGIGTYSQVGAAYGTAIVWTAPAVLPMAIAVQETSARLGLVTGRGLASLIRERFSRPVLLFAVLLVIVANTFNIGADLGSMAAAAHLVVPIPTLVLLVMMTALMLTLVLTLHYHQYARVLRWLAVSLGTYVVVLFSVHVDWSAVAREVVSPDIAGGRSNLVALIAIFGTTVSPYLFFWQAAEEVEEGHQQEEHGDAEHPEAVAPSSDQIGAMRVDVVGGMLSGVGVMFAIVVAAAATLHQSGVHTVATAEEAARALEPIAGSLAGLVFAIGIVGLGLLAVPVLAGSTAYALTEALGLPEGLSARVRRARGFYTVIVASMLIGFAMNLFGVDSIRALYWSAILNGIAAPPLVILMLVLARSRSLMGGHRSGVLSSAGMLVTVLVSVALPVLALLVK